MNSLIIVFLFGGLSALIAIGIAAAALSKAWRDFHQTHSARNWQTVNASITHSAVEELPEGGGDGPRLFRLRLRYSYQVADVRCEGKRMYLGDDPIGSQTEMQKLSSSYPVGMPVKVHFNPINPAEAVLIIESQSSKKALFLGIFFVLVSFCIVCITLSYPLLVK
jgi:hypothetical protein